MDKAKFEEEFKNFHDDRFPDVFETPVFDDDSPTHTSKDFDWSYLMHCNWAASRLARRIPSWHVDLGSYVYFSAIASLFTGRHTFVDIRPLDLRLSGVESIRADFRNLPFHTGSVPSISCLHTLEHVGLGRYGDAIDPEGDIKAAGEIKHVLSTGGHLLVVVPMNKNKRINFNSHRIYDRPTFEALFSYLEITDRTIFFDKRELGEREPLPEGDFTACYEFVK